MGGSIVGYTEPRWFAIWLDRDGGGIRMALYLEMIANANGEDEGTVGRSKSEWVSVRIAMV